MISRRLLNRLLLFGVILTIVHFSGQKRDCFESLVSRLCPVCLSSFSRVVALNLNNSTFLWSSYEWVEQGFDSTCLRDYFEITSTCLRQLLCKSLKIRHIKNAMNRLQNSAILIIGNFILIIPKLLIQSMFVGKKVICRCFALHNS